MLGPGLVLLTDAWFPDRPQYLLLGIWVGPANGCLVSGLVPLIDIRFNIFITMLRPLVIISKSYILLFESSLLNL